EAILRHGGRHVVLPLFGGRQVDQGVVLGGRLQQCGEHARVRQAEVVRVGPEVTAGGGLYAVGLAAVEDRVQVHLEDLALRVVPIHDQGQDGLFGFALDGVVGVGADEQLLDELLADGATTLLDAVVGVVGQGGAEDRG